YDRAALVALPPDMRQRYVNHLLRILPANTQILLVILDYLQHEMAGPPFAVSLQEVAALYQNRAEITVLSQRDVLAQTPRFQERGLSRLEEYVILLKTFAP
ncbi:MAG: thiopurine S-methyltransferase, partial [Betaproteobacteria bacterium]|nr:thiopurine S-methyltransferase [Betaproteobacteria bacterium]